MTFTHFLYISCGLPIATPSVCWKVLPSGVINNSSSVHISNSCLIGLRCFWWRFSWFQNDNDDTINGTIAEKAFNAFNFKKMNLNEKLWLIYTTIRSGK